ncbi:tripartite tricarboxylate transporter permease [Pelagibacterium lacus]|uniref:Tat pathway signal protein n=1 Tax=Pelagibacterium lacus TaxID=2282655 RepID=A0A369VZQ5_9HYPH|nr:tripartite tricarboxylate transporter permease [Pelagibacterium lacus]RDE07894.1 Tat pathway signal protein [Pelagibacterium lacus]
MLGQAVANLGETIPLFFTLNNMILISAGVLFGLFVGAIPGFSTSMALVLLLPFTFGINPINGLSLMIGVLIGSISGGLVTTNILGIASSSSSIPSLWDGHTLSKKGEGAYSVGIALWASFFGGMISWAVLVTFAPMIARIGLQFGPWDFFALMVFSLTIAASVSSGTMTKGLLATGLGLLVALVGRDPISGVNRFTFDIPFLTSGFEILVVLIGVFAFSQRLYDMQDRERTHRSMGGGSIRFEGIPHLRAVKTNLQNWPTLLRSSLIGVFIGVVPALGGNVSSILAYDQERKLARPEQKFGEGEPAGIIAPEAANNADAGGSLTVLMALGIPGDIVSVVLLAALTLHNVAPSPMFITDHPTIAYTIYISFLVASILMVFFQSITIRFFLLLRWVPDYLINLVLFLCAMGVFVWAGTFDSLWVLLLFGLFGYAMRSLGFPIAPFILGAVLAEPVEVNLVRSLSSSADVSLFFIRPWAMLFWVLTLYSLLFPLYHSMGRRWRIIQSLYYPSLGLLLSIPLFMMGSFGAAIAGLLFILVSVWGGYTAMQRQKAIQN